MYKVSFASMIKKGDGEIIDSFNWRSMGRVYQVHYAAASALINLTKSIAKSYSKDGTFTQKRAVSLD